MNNLLKLTPWHDFLSTIFELAIGSMDHDRGVSTKPPKIDVTLRQELGGWTSKQRAMLPDGIRDSTAKHILMEFKYTESLTLDAMLQAIGYEKFFRTTRKLKWEEVQMFVLSSKTPQKERLIEFGYEQTDLPGFYRSNIIYARHIPLLVLNQLRDEPHNALTKIFASRKKEKAKAFLSLQKLEGLPSELLNVLEALWTLWSLPEGTNMNEILTPERVLEMSKEWKSFMFQQLSAEEADIYLKV